jgi:hypothetical protein
LEGLGKMFGRTLLAGCLALIIVARTVHCLYVDALLCAHAAAASSDSPLPLSDPTESDPNESGCICKGALVGVPCQAADPRAIGESTWSFEAVPSLPDSSLVASKPVQARQQMPPPISGKTLRALCASWQI